MEQNKERKECERCGWDDSGFQHEPYCPLFNSIKENLDRFKEVDELFDKEFIREDGLLDIGKYDSDVVKSFVHQVLSEQAEEILKSFPKEWLVCSHMEDSGIIMAQSYNECLSSCKEVVRKYIK